MTWPNDGENARRYPAIFAIVNCVWLLVLLVSFHAYWTYLKWGPIDLNFLNLAERLRGHDPIGGILPAYVPWAGCLGGVMISLLGCAKWTRDWDSKWNIWHVLRPALGAVSGSVGFLILVLVLRTAAGTDTPLTQIPVSPTSQATFFVIAFLIGFRDRLFLELIAKVTKTLLTTGEDDDEKRPTFRIEPETLAFASTKVGSSSQLVARITLTNPAAVADLPDGWYAVDATDPAQAAAFQVTLGQTANLAAHYRDIVATFTPATVGDYQADLKITIGDIERIVDLKGTGA